MDGWLPLTTPGMVFLTVFLTVLLAPLVARSLGLPGLLGLILAGVLVGPNGLGLLEREGAVLALGEAGLLYLMFLGGLDLDLDGFEEHRRDSVIFGTSTLVIPMALNAWVAVLLGFSLPAALLIAAAITSHTLVNYPLVQRLGLSRNRAVTASLGATLPANVGALLVLAVVAGVTGQDNGASFWVLFAFGLVALTALTAWGWPRLTRWFFTNYGQDRNTRFVYVLVILFGGAAFARATGIEPIVGAFLAGLALNRFVPPGSVLMDRVSFLGSVLLVPVFLMATGMLVNPVGLMREPRTLVVGAALTGVALASKWIAAFPVAKLLHFDRAELGVMFALTGAQAAGAIAAAVVGLEIGLLDQSGVDAVVMVVLGTLIVTPPIGERYAPRIDLPTERIGKLGERVVVPIANPASTGTLMHIGALLAAPDNGRVVPVSVLPFEAAPEQIAEQRRVTEAAEKLALGRGADAAATVRIDTSPAAGILHEVVETGGTAVLIGWKGFANLGENLFGSVIDEILAELPVPAYVCRTVGELTFDRVVLSLTPGDLAAAGTRSLELALEAATRIARSAGVPLLVVSEQNDSALPRWVEEGRIDSYVVDQRKPPIALRGQTTERDLVVLGTPPTRAGLGQNAARVAKALPDRPIVAAVPRSAP